MLAIDRENSSDKSLQKIADKSETVRRIGAARIRRSSRRSKSAVGRESIGRSKETGPGHRESSRIDRLRRISRGFAISDRSSSSTLLLDDRLCGNDRSDPWLSAVILASILPLGRAFEYRLWIIWLASISAVLSTSRVIVLHLFLSLLIVFSRLLGELSAIDS